MSYIVLQLATALFIPRVNDVIVTKTVKVVSSTDAIDFLADGTATVIHDNEGMGYEKESDALAAMLAYQLHLEETYGVIKQDKSHEERHREIFNDDIRREIEAGFDEEPC